MPYIARLTTFNIYKYIEIHAGHKKRTDREIDEISALIDKSENDDQGRSETLKDRLAALRFERKNCIEATKWSLSSCLLLAETSEQWYAAAEFVASFLEIPRIAVLRVENPREQIFRRVANGPLEVLEGRTCAPMAGGLSAEVDPVLLLITDMQALDKAGRHQRDTLRIIADYGWRREPRLLPEGSVVLTGARGTRLAHGEAEGMAEWRLAAPVENGAAARADLCLDALKPEM